MRVAILGDSHVACLKQALDQTPDALNGAQATFFAAPRTLMRKLSVANGALLPASPGLEARLRHTSGGLGTIDTAAYDAFVLVGLQFKLKPLDGALSRAVCTAAMRARCANTLMRRTVERLRTTTNAPIVIGHTPLRATPTRRGSAVRPDDLPPFPPHSYEETLHFAAAAFADLDATLLAQPDATRVEDWHTAAQFAVRSVGLSGVSHDSTETGHMNAGYGAIYLASVAQRLAFLADESANVGVAGEGP